MQVIETELNGVLIIEPRTFEDPRGLFFETYQATRYQEKGIHVPFVQDNISYSQKNVLRGLHYQLKKPQDKLVFVTYGKVLDVVVDIRRHSKTFGQHLTVELSHTNHRQVFVPKGFAHGFCVLSERADFIYKCSDYYDPSSEMGIHWADPDLNIPWPIQNPILSDKDACYPFLKDISHELLLT